MYYYIPSFSLGAPALNLGFITFSTLKVELRASIQLVGVLFCILPIPLPGIRGAILTSCSECHNLYLYPTLRDRVDKLVLIQGPN